MKIRSYYELLSSDADDDIKNIPTSSLGFSRTTALVFFKDTTIENGKIKQRFPKVGDLLSYGRARLEGLFVSRVKSYNDLQDVILEVEEKLAKLGLKFSDSEFSVGDVRVNNLQFKPSTQKFINKFSHKIKTLDDLSTFSATKISNFSIDNGYDMVMEISTELEKYGLKLEGSPYRINKENFFPLNDFADYLPKNSPRIVKPTKSVKSNNTIYTEEARQELLSMDREDLLAVSINRLPLSSKIKQAFDKYNIITIGDLINTNQNFIKSSVTSDQFRLIENVLASYNLKFYNSKREIKDGRIVRQQSSRTTPKAPKPQDITKLSKEEQDKFLDTKILDFGLSEYLESPFKNQEVLITMRDLVNTTKHDIATIIQDDNVATSISRLLKSYGLSQKQPNRSLIVSKYVNEVQIYRNNLPENPTEEDKKSYMKMPLLTAGFTQELIDVIHGAGIPAETIEDVISHKRIDFTHGGMTDAQVRAMRCVLINYGLTVEAEDKYKDRPKRGQGKKNTQEQTYEERKNEYKQIVCDYLAKKGQSSQQDDTTSNNSSERT